MAKISFYTDSPHGRTIIVCYRSDFTNFCFSVCILSNTKKNSLFHTVGYKNHSVGYIFHSVGYKFRTVKQRICKSVQKNVTGYAELINRAERIIAWSACMEVFLQYHIATRAATFSGHSSCEYNMYRVDVYILKNRRKNFNNAYITKR